MEDLSWEEVALGDDGWSVLMADGIEHSTTKSCDRDINVCTYYGASLYENICLIGYFLLQPHIGYYFIAAMVLVKRSKTWADADSAKVDPHKDDIDEHSEQDHSHDLDDMRHASRAQSPPDTPQDWRAFFARRRFLFPVGICRSCSILQQEFKTLTSLS
jgi:hypothetical protein